MSTLISTNQAGNYSLALLQGGELDVQVVPSTGPSPPTTTFARNSAEAPALPTAITTTAAPPTQAVSWNSIELGVPPSVNVTITPRVSGVVQLAAALNVSNPSGGALAFSAAFTVGGLALSPVASVTVPAGGTGNLSMLLTLPSNALGTPIDVGVVVSGNGLSLPAGGCTLAVQELATAA